ncbi:MAG TPA: NHL repeat-containing protein [Gaiellales bacterium]|jgi:DNA-binding beta-propeller fold protein YncE
MALEGTHVCARPSARRRRRVVCLAWAGLLLLAAAPAFGATSTFNATVTAGGTAVRTHPFAVTSPGPVTATLDWTDASANLTLALVNPSGATVATGTGTKPRSLTYNAPSAGTYKLRVKAVSGSSAYTASATYTGAPPFQRFVPTDPTRAGHAEIYPSGLDVGPDGTVYVADTGGDQVQAYAANGALLWTTGSRGTKTLGRFNNPRDVAYAVVGGQPTLFVDDTGYNRVQVLDATTGRALSAWAFRFPSTLGISVGVDGSGTPIVLVAEDSQNRIQTFDTSGNLLQTVTGSFGGKALLGPRDAATDSNGNIYVADYGNDRIVKFSPSGGVLTAWGSHGSADGQFLRPYGVDVDSSDHVYVADSDNERIQEFDTTGGHIANFGQAGLGASDFQQLRRVAVGPGAAPDVYGADLWTFKVVELDSTGASVRVFGNVPPADGQFNEPSGMAFDGAGHMFVADAVNQRIQRFIAATGGYDLKWGQRGWGSGVKDGFNWPRDITYASSTATLWVADTKNNRMVEFATDGTPTGRKFGLAGTGATAMNWPYGVASLGGDLIVADTFNNRVERWTPPATPPVKPVAGTVDWSQNIADGIAFKAPYDVAVSGGNVYVADATNKRIVVLDAATGDVVQTFGSANLHQPQGVAVDPDTGNIWVADTSFNRVVEFTGTGSFVLAFGRAGVGPGQFNKPTHIAVDGGLLYVADTWNDRVQVFSLG